MLALLRAENLILIETLELEFEPGFNVLTGETGAGKSLLVGALQLVLGGKASSAHVRPGASGAEVEALFSLSAKQQTLPNLSRLREAGTLAGDELCIRRSVSTSGRSRATINGRLCTIGELAALAPELVDIASQHESVALTDPATHLYYLDQFASLGLDRGRLGERVDALSELVAELRSLRESERSRAEREAFLDFQLAAIEEIDPKPGELEELQTERRRVRHSERIQGLTQSALQRLEGDDGLVDALALVESDLRRAAELDPDLTSIVDAVAAAAVSIDEAGRDLRRMVDKADLDPNRLSEIEGRLFKLEQLLRQHGPTLDDLLSARERLDEERTALSTSPERLAALTERFEQELRNAGELADALSARRKKAARVLGTAITTQLSELGMGGARVVVEVEPAPARAGKEDDLVTQGLKLRRDGFDRVEFLIAPNKGIDPKPLRKIASGGELSRALLALKRVLAEHGPAGLYVFDEVDTGVGGAVAERIGEAIGSVAKHHQVLCVTHLAPIAAHADAHFVVTKQDQEAVTKSAVRRVQGDERIGELARMLGGKRITSATLRAARDLMPA